MKFKKNADYMKFFATVKKCKGDVLFYTLEGENEEDVELLKEFLDTEK